MLAYYGQTTPALVVSILAIVSSVAIWIWYIRTNREQRKILTAQELKQNIDKIAIDKMIRYFIISLITILLVGTSSIYFIIQSSKHFYVSLLGGDTFDAPQGMVGVYTGLDIHAKVWNTGSPQAMSKWFLTINPKGDNPVVVYPIRFYDSINITDLYMITTAINSTPVNGDLRFLVPLSETIIAEPTTQWKLSVESVSGKTVYDAHFVNEWPVRNLR